MNKEEDEEEAGGVMGKVFEELCREAREYESRSDRESRAESTHQGRSHLICLICYKTRAICGLIFISPEQKGKESILGLSTHKEK